MKRLSHLWTKYELIMIHVVLLPYKCEQGGFKRLKRNWRSPQMAWAVPYPSQIAAGNMTSGLQSSAAIRINSWTAYMKYLRTAFMAGRWWFTSHIPCSWKWPWLGVLVRKDLRKTLTEEENWKWSVPSVNDAASISETPENGPNIYESVSSGFRAYSTWFHDFRVWMIGPVSQGGPATMPASFEWRRPLHSHLHGNSRWAVHSHRCCRCAIPLPFLRSFAILFCLVFSSAIWFTPCLMGGNNTF